MIGISKDPEGLPLFTMQDHAVLDSMSSLYCASSLRQEREQLLAVLTNLTAMSEICRWIVEKHSALLPSVITKVDGGDPAPGQSVTLKLRGAQLLSNISLHEPSKLNSLLDEHWPSFLPDIFSE